MPISPPQVSELVEKLVEDQGFDLEDVTVTRRDGTDELTIVVDRDGGSDLDVLADLSNRISAVPTPSPISPTPRTSSRSPRAASTVRSPIPGTGDATSAAASR